MLVRLQKVLAAAGVASRREAEEWIAAGRVRVDGQVVTQPGTKVDPGSARIDVDGREIRTQVPHVYLLLYKPRGFVTTRADPHAPHTVMELVRPGLEARLGRGHPAVEGLHPVGRLDADSEGLLLMTNDGAFTHALTHPRHQVRKTYVAEVDGLPDREALARLRQGILLDGRPTAKAAVRLLPLRQGDRRARVEITIHEGRNRQVRRMLAAVGQRVTHLCRTRVGELSLGRLKPGAWRFLDGAEVAELVEQAGGDE
jgi:pseudouridine synthase